MRKKFKFLMIAGLIVLLIIACIGWKMSGSQSTLYYDKGVIYMTIGEHNISVLNLENEDVPIVS